MVQGMIAVHFNLACDIFNKQRRKKTKNFFADQL